MKCKVEIVIDCEQEDKEELHGILIEYLFKLMNLTPINCPVRGTSIKFD